MFKPRDYEYMIPRRLIIFWNDEIPEWFPKRLYKHISFFSEGDFVSSTQARIAKMIKYVESAHTSFIPFLQRFSKIAREIDLQYPRDETSEEGFKI
eukprot:CAMPEP_0114600582 /NCGR_PEP_ID=MMETSP0125-20121206/23180_1 /TAXON_ID=485358 ORGANISM="Aristerostoma sp., Strain ATCC 50986" /NCGR_SAMPLE_ID=MMETSP0125 /ASSEMBLY_ACC=CAM_ASM_000245 /LENGTH=95 /DNA_ID=CAMNT_0001808913 /DNA_START=46 /DNA_END=333 /DNA_ORIENTATION=-